MKELTSPQAAYLQERGFQIQTRKLDHTSAFPFVTMGQIGLDELNYQYDRNICGRIIFTTCHPSQKSTSELVNAVEYLVAGAMTLEEKIFTTSPGTPIPIYILDPAWNDVARALEIQSTKRHL